MPRYGFNFQWMYTGEYSTEPLEADQKALDFMQQFGFDFARIPVNYFYFTRDFDYFNPDERILAYLDRYLQACQQRGIHMSLNLHRAPGYCINFNDLEKHNLWQDEIAQDAFVFLWELFAQRYRGVPSSQLSFDLLNEPPEIGQYGMTRDIHENLMRRTVAAIRAIDPHREMVIDGLGGGNIAMPELADLGVVHSGRGYQPMTVSHYRAEWWDGSKGMPMPTYPDCEWDGKTWNIDTLREYYRPWLEIRESGVQVHIGEFGCYKYTPNDVALRWFRDLFQVYRELGWGFALWEFSGNFGIAGHNRPGVVYEEFHGYQIDRELLNLMLESRVQPASV
ncbi:glycoside hydrolase family 5 protein [Deinococcus roseus]|uniref:Endoglucanase n=1 Tax=Deinococcus roseus TaxID=392414 RepID=A0ABQ2DIB9_9DEIO|nr:cellulase family glycosylhydrolase [Deinococcus roseus]GGJ59086.1 endoglucanase [Deinococcus roseus]